MTEQQQKIQNLLDDFIGRNVSEIERVSKENPLLLKSVLDVVSIISKKYGEGKSAEIKTEEPVEEKSEEKRLFKVGDYFRHKNAKDELAKIIGLTSDDRVEVMRPDAETLYFTLTEVNQFFKDGTWVNIGDPYKKGYFEKKPTEIIEEKKILPFQEGDEFYHKNQKDVKYKFAQVDDEDVYVLLPTTGKKVHYDTNEAVTLVNEGDWILTSKFEQPKIVDPEKVDEIKVQETEQLSAEDIKAAIKNLKPLAEFDEDVKKEIERLKQQLKGLKTKKS
jgi:hypothetical protein